jgi:hypothetical protein
MRQLSRYAISLAVAGSCLVATLPTEAPAQGATAGASINQGVRNARSLIRQANRLADALGEAPCDFILRNNILEQSERMLDQLWDLMQAAELAGATGLAEDLDAAGQNLADAREYYDEECGGPSRVGVLSSGIFARKFVEIDIAAGGIQAVLPNRTFLGSESGGVPRTGLFATDRDATGASVSASLKFDTSGLLSVPLNFGSGTSSSWTKLGFFYAHASSDQTIGTIDVGAGSQILVPGPLGGASGFAFPLGAPAQGVTYSNDLSKAGGRVDFGQTTRLPNNLSVDLYGSLGYARTSFDERFSGTISGLNFRYDSDAHVDQMKLRLGAGLRKEIALQGGLTFSYGGYGEIGPDFSWGSGRDRLSVTGFADSSTSPSAARTAPGYRLGLTAGVQTSAGFKLSLEGAYMRESALPVFDRDGNNPTRLELKSGDVWTGMVRGSLRF